MSQRADLLVWEVADVQAVAAQSARPQSLSAYGDQPFLILSLQSASRCADAQALSRWLRELVCPVIGLRDPASNDCGDPSVIALTQACDVVVDERQALDELVSAIEARPVAATCFVRLLRVTETMPVLAAMDVESSVFSSLQGGAEYQQWLLGRAARQRPTETGPAVLLEKQSTHIEITLNRPENRNAMSVEMRDGLMQALSQAAQDEAMRPVRILGKGRHFSTGGDLAEFGQVPDTASGHLIRLLSVPGRFLADIADRVTVELHGHCVGSGIEFPAFAGRVLARPDTRFSLPEVGMGLIPGAGGCISMARRIGRQRLAWLGLTGKIIDADLALDWGLVDEIAE